jgi:hypothetical protein
LVLTLACGNTVNEIIAADSAMPRQLNTTYLHPIQICLKSPMKIEEPEKETENEIYLDVA